MMTAKLTSLSQQRHAESERDLMCKICPNSAASAPLSTAGLRLAQAVLFSRIEDYGFEKLLEWHD